MSPMLSPGARLGRYEIKTQLGAGGRGEVYLAEDRKLDRKVALKVLPADLAANQDRMRRFVQEAKAAAALNHPNIAPFTRLVRAKARTLSRWSLSTARPCGRRFTAKKANSRFCSNTYSRSPKTGESARVGHSASRSQARQHHDHARQSCQDS